jgi:alanine racemase
MRHTFAEVNLAHLQNNFLNIRKKVKSAKVMAVIKADGYGHGAYECAKSLTELGEKKPDYMALALLEEAIDLRKAGIKLPALCFAPFSKEDIDNYVKYDINTTIFADEHLKVISAAKDKKIKAHIKIDTGMSRLGIRFNEAYEFINRAAQIKNLSINGIYTHFATSDEKDKTFAIEQLRRFKDIIDALKRSGINYGLAHCANSGAILDMPDSYMDMVRPGIILYGYYPSKETSESIRLNPVMTICSELDTVKEFTRGDSVSYGRKHYIRRKEMIASVAFGYADGYLRGLSNNACGIIRGQLYRQVGSICMDRSMFDVTEGSFEAGERIILLGSSKNVKFDAGNWADILNTIPYEILCGISKRVPRIYTK